MTAPEDRETHPDVIEISDLAEGLLTPERAAEVQTHVASCALCEDVLDSLQEVQGLLGELPPAEPMPAEVAARIDAALAATPRDVPRETAPVPGRPGIDVPRRADVPRGTSAPSGHPSAPTRPGRGRRHFRGLSLVVASCAAILAVGWLGYQQLAQDDQSGPMKADSSGVGQSRAQAPDSSDTVGDQVARLLGPHGSQSSGAGNGSPMLTSGGDGTVVAPDRTATAVPVCVLQAIRRGEQPLAAEAASYQGVPSFLVVLPDPADATQVDAFVVTSECSADVPARVLFQNSYPRP